MDNTDKQTTRNILSVIAGVITAAALFLLGGLILLLNIASKSKGHGEESDLGNISLSGIILLVICCFAGGFVTGKISTKKNIVHGLICGIVLVALMTFMGEAAFDNESIISAVIIIISTLAGTFVAEKMK